MYFRMGFLFLSSPSFSFFTPLSCNSHFVFTQQKDAHVKTGTMNNISDSL